MGAEVKCHVEVSIEKRTDFTIDRLYKSTLILTLSTIATAVPGPDKPASCHGKASLTTD
jgi:hypothetical protein